jgi:hypothetical protein
MPCREGMLYMLRVMHLAAATLLADAECCFVWPMECLVQHS